MQNSKSWQLSRRHALRGIGATMALPLLEAMVPLNESLGAGANRLPIRFAGFFMPNGVDHSRFDPKGPNLNKLPPTLLPLQELRQYLTVITGMNNADAGHAAGTASFLTGQRTKKTSKANEVNVGNASLDQIIGNTLGKSCPLPTLELGLHTPKSGVSMSGHSKIYQSFSSWKTARTPVPHEIHPQRAFDRLFKNAQVTGKPRPTAQTSLRPDKSVLDIVLQDAKDLQKRLGRSDQQKLDEYLTSVRDVESRISNQSRAVKELLITQATMSEIKKASSKIRRASGDNKRGNYRTSPDIPYREHGRLMMDLMALALWSNTSRASTLMFGDGLHQRNLSFIEGVNGNHHSLSHHGNTPNGLKTFAKINTFFMEQYAYFLTRLKNMPEGGSNVLENSVVLLGSNISNGQKHSRDDIPLVVAGHGGGRIRGNRHLAAKGEPIAKLHRSILNVVNIDGKKIKGNGTLKGFA